MPPLPSTQTNPDVPLRDVAEVLCVDLDGTLLSSDTLWESLLALLEKRPWFLFVVPLWLLRGKAHLKQEIAARANLDAASLPFRSDVVAFLEEEKRRGRRLILVTGADQRIAQGVAQHIGLFDGILASEGAVNLTGAAKKRAIVEYLKGAAFDYIGDGMVDLVIWDAAAGIYVVAPSPSLRRKLQQGRTPARVFEGTRGWAKPLWRALRPHQWVKNFLVFVPLLMAHKVSEPARLTGAVLAFVSFCFCASGTYVINDLLDLRSDRRHPRKRSRPFAAGTLPLWLGCAMAPTLLVLGLLTGLMVVQRTGNAMFLPLIAAYVVTTVAYSIWLKRIPLVDVLVLTSVYLLRILSGGVAASVPVSPWLLAFSMFLLLSTAFAKRYTELLLAEAKEESTRSASRRGYAPGDAGLMREFGITSGYVSVLVLALYVNGNDVAQLYRHPQLIWLICPALLFWVSRLWLLASRQQLHDDPVVFAARDPVSYLMGALVMLIVWMAI